jgi:hypothetical protein
MLTQLNDDGQEFWCCMPIGPTITQRPNIVHMKGNALLLFGQFFFFKCYLYGSPFTLVTN